MKRIKKIELGYYFILALGFSILYGGFPRLYLGIIAGVNWIIFCVLLLKGVKKR